MKVVDGERVALVVLKSHMDGNVMYSPGGPNNVRYESNLNKIKNLTEKRKVCRRMEESDKEDAARKRAVASGDAAKLAAPKRPKGLEGLEVPEAEDVAKKPKK